MYNAVTSPTLYKAEAEEAEADQTCKVQNHVCYIQVQFVECQFESCYTISFSLNMDLGLEDSTKVCTELTRQIAIALPNLISVSVNEPRREKTGFLHMRKQKRRSASRKPRS